MTDLMKKGLLTFNNTVSIRGYDRVNLLGAIYMIMYGAEHESKFNTTDIKVVHKKKNMLYMMNAPVVVEYKTAAYEVFTNYFEQNAKAKEEFDNLEDCETSDDKITAVFEKIKNGTVQSVPTIDEAVTASEGVVEEVAEESADVPTADVTELASTSETTVASETTETSDTDDDTKLFEIVASEVSPEVADAVVAELQEGEQLDAVMEEVAAAVTEGLETVPVVDGDEFDDILPPIPTVVETQEEVLAGNSTPSKEVVDETDTEEVVEESVKPLYNQDLVILDEDNKYEKLLRGKLTKEVASFRILPNAYSASQLCNKIMSLLNEADLIKIVYDKEIVHVLYEEFEGAAYLLSSFRCLAIGIATGGVK